MKTFSKRFLTMLLAVVMVFSLSGMTAFAAEEDTSGEDISTYAVGEEPEINGDGQYEIASVENLEWFADQVNSGNNSIDGIVTETFDASASESFTPIGTSSAKFKGTFDGDGHTITLNLDDSDASYQALFGYTDGATIRNVTVDGSVSGSTYVAGVIASASGSTVVGCVNEAAITNTGDYTGGVVAYTMNAITDCGNDGAVTSDGMYVGGIAGYATNGVVVSGCYNHVAVEGLRTVGGIVGYGVQSISVDSCYNTGAITMTMSGGSNAYCVAGIVGILAGSGSSVSNVFNTGMITVPNSSTTNYIGALTGGGNSLTSGHSIANGYYLEGTAAAAYAPGGWGNANVTVTAVASKTSEEIAAADFLDLINENDAFLQGEQHPILRWEYDENAPVDKSTLQAEYDEDIQITNTGYASARWEPFAEALETAQKVLDTPDEELTQLEVDTALYALRNAKANLTIPVRNADGQYEIANVWTLEWFAEQVNGGNNSIDGIVTADIDASASESFSPIGTADTNFTGTFDGDGHTITLNLNNTEENYQALFGYTYTAAISNVTVDGSVSGNQYVAGIIAYMDASNISGCVNKAAITSTSTFAGGVVGYAYTRNTLGSFTNGTIINCGNDGAVTAGSRYAGGVVAGTKADGNDSTTITGCYNHADIVGECDLGGIMGTASNSSATAVDSCYNTGNITETGTQTSNSYCSGGLVGIFAGSSSVSNSFNMGTVTGGSSTRQDSLVGALVGGGAGTGSYMKLDHVYYLEGTCEYNGEDRYCASGSQGGVSVVDDSVASKTAEEMKEIEFLDLVNANLTYTLGTDHPILMWESDERTSYMALREEYNEDLLLDWADYTTETWEVFEATLQAAGELLEDPDATDEDYDKMLKALQDAKEDLVYIEPDYTVKYAVSIYDINKDVDEDGNTLGLTFGPATAQQSYIRTYKAHLTQEEYEAGEGICLHWMSWKDIVRQSKENPEAFRDCLNNGCTHSIEMTLNDTLLASDYSFVRMIGDGCGVLYYSIANTYLQANFSNGEYHNYGATTFRTTLNTASYSLLSCFPEDLQNGIAPKKTSYAQTAGSSIAEYCYDKLWLFSLYELGQGGSSVEGSQYYRPTSTNVNNSADNRTYKLYNYYETGEYGDWMLPRSLYGSFDRSIYSVHYEGDGIFGTITGGGSGGLSPGFCLAGPDPAGELSAFAVYSADDSSLTFYTDYDIPTVGSSYNEKAVTKVYKNVDQTVAESTDDIPWEDVCTDAADVVIDSTFADAQPTSFAYWFDGFSNASFSGLSYMDTTNVTSMSYMFHDCAAVTRLDLSDWDTTSVTDGVEFATGCTNLQRVRIGEKTNIFTLSQNVDQPNWYDNSINGNLVSDNYLMDVTDAGTYWSYTEGVEGYITIKVGEETSPLSYETIDAALANAESDTFTCGSSSVTAKFVLLSDLIGIDYDFCSYTVTAAGDESVTSGLPTDTYLYKTEDGAYRTAVDDGPESQWISNPDTIEVVVDHDWGDIKWTWTGLPLYCTTDNPDFEPLSVAAIQPWNVAESLRIATLAGDTINATATATATCENCGETETVDAELSAEYLSDAPTEYVGALAEITATATFSDGQKATDAVKVLAPATGAIAVNYMRDDETVKTDSVPYANINELINQVEPFAVHYTASGGNDTYLTMPFVSITDALGMSEDENFCCFTAYGTDGFSAILPADAYLYQRNKKDNSGNNYYYRTAVTTNSDRPTVRSSQAFVSYVDSVDVQYMHQWGTPEWTWSEDYSSATVIVACTRDNGAGMVVCNYSDKVDATIDVTTEGGYIVYTATATLVDGTIVTDVQRVVDTREAFAFYSADDNSLTFAYDKVPAEGDTYNGKTVTAVYDNVDSVSAASADEIPWYSVRTDVTDVVIDETFYEVQPISLAYWFHEFSSLESLDVSGMDTTNIADVEGFANGCTNLKWVKIGENTDVFRKGQAVVDQSTWYDSDVNGTVVSENYLQDVTAAGQYWTYTTYEVPTISDMEITSNVEGNSKAYDGAGFNLSVSATVEPEGADVTYQWYGPDGAAIESANSSVYTTGSNVADSGTYTCTVTATNVTESTSADGTIDLAITAAEQDISYAQDTVEKYEYDENFTNELTTGTVFGDITYASSDATVATVDETTGAVTIVGIGTAEITATAAADSAHGDAPNYTEATASYTLTVSEAAIDSEVDVDGDEAEWDEDNDEWVDNTTYDGEPIELTMVLDLSEEEQGEVAAISYQWYRFVPETSDYEPIEGATNDTYTLTGEDVNAGDYTYMCIAVVTYKNGYAHTVTSSPIEVNIAKAAQTIMFESESVEKTVGDEPFTNPISADSKIDTEGGAAITYTSSDESIAAVDADGEVKIPAVGEVTITATASETTNYEEASASYTLTVSEADKAALQTEYDADILLNEDDYTADSWTPFEAALEDAEAILADENAPQKAVDDALTALESAKEGLQEKAAQEISFAESSVTKTVGDEPFANELIETTVDTAGGAYITYTSSDETIATVDETGQVTILAEGEVTITATVSATANYAEASASYALTIEAAPEPTPPVDKTALEKAIADAEGLDADKYTEDSWSALETALAAAKTVDAEESATQDEVDKALDALENAINGLVEKTPADKEVLETTIANAEALNKDDYTEESWNAMQTALDAAKAVAADDDATQSEVDQATIDLVTAIASLESPGEEPGTETDKSDLLKEYTEAMSLSESDYTTESWAPFAQALATARSVLTDPDATQEDVDAAEQALKTAKDNLVEKSADKEVLETTIANAEALKEDDYTEESWNVMQAALDAAKAVDADEDVTQADVDAATIELVSALANLQFAEEPPAEQPDKTDLLNEYVEGMKLDESNYTPESWAPFAQALADAQSVLTDPDATQDDVDAAEQALKAAMDNLEENAPVKNGLCQITPGELWGYYVDGVVDETYTGFASNENGDWWVVDGYVKFDVNSVEKDPTGKYGDKGVSDKGTWWYVVGNKVQHDFTGLANYKNANGWWYIKDGKVDFSHNGVDKNKNGWYYVMNGKVRFDFTGLSNYRNDNGWWYIAGGKVDFTHNGVDKNVNGWYYVTGGKVRFDYTGVANYKNANGWWYIAGGKVDFTYTGRASNKNGTWNVVNGKVVF